VHLFIVSFFVAFNGVDERECRAWII